MGPGFRSGLTAPARDGSAAHRPARRANAPVLLGAGWSCERIAGALPVDDDTIRQWHNLFADGGVEGLARFEAGGGACRTSAGRQAQLKDRIAATLPGSTRQTGAWIEAQSGLACEGRSGSIALPHRLDCRCRKPDAFPRKLDEARQQAFIEACGNLLNGPGANAAVLFMDAAHPARHRADRRAPAHQHPRRHRPGNRADPRQALLARG